jgi:hypothetical protein
MVQVSALRAFSHSPPPSWKKRIATCTGCLLFTLATFHIWKKQPVVTTHNASHTIQTKYVTPASSANNPVVHQESIDGIQVLWTAPISNKPPCGILLVCHGCSHSGTDFFQCEDDEQGCLGLPEELAVVQIALDHFNLVVVALSSQHREHKCWSTEQDGPRAAKVLSEFSTRFSVDKKEQIPIFAFGASSGGFFVSQLGSAMMEQQGLVLDGFLSQISAKTSPVEVECTVYITMNRDTKTDENARDIVGNNDEKNAKKKHIRLPPLSLSPTYFSDRIPSISQEVSSHIYTALLENGYLDQDTKFLIQDPRGSQWRSLVGPLLTSSQDDSLQADQSPIGEVLNVAYGLHEMAREGVKEGLEFCVASLPEARRQSC